MKKDELQLYAKNILGTNKEEEKKKCFFPVL